MPLARWICVPAAGIRPEDSAVEPCAIASRSSISTSAPASRVASAAVMPAAPAPTIATGTSSAKETPAAGRTLMYRVR